MGIAEIIAAFGSIMNLVAKYRLAREQWREANPGQDDKLPDETKLFDLLQADSEHLKAHAAEVIARYSDPQP